MENVIIYGAGSTGEKLYRLIQVENEFNIVCFADSYTKIQDEKFGLPIISPKQINDYNFDYIVVATLTGWEEVTKILVNDFNIRRERIITKYVENSIEARIAFLRNYSQLIYEKNLHGSVAEGGIYQGEFAKYINKYFPDRKLYLFDTFEGFDSRDIKTEISNKFSTIGAGENLKHQANIDLVKSKMRYKENCIFKQGYFPESAHDVDDKFVFVNLDFDLYNPILSGLEFFYPRMVVGGIILVHDYFSDFYKGVKSAINDFAKTNNKINPIPIGDDVSVAIIKL